MPMQASEDMRYDDQNMMNNAMNQPITHFPNVGNYEIQMPSEPESDQQS